MNETFLIIISAFNLIVLFANIAFSAHHIRYFGRELKELKGKWLRLLEEYEELNKRAARLRGLQ